ncbi:CYTH domain-containing protein [Pantanalinema sp. GBBB05]|uniref:CYTH domain-containing protein n=1 Tax=Pantanalinema sp. GBBB05 TaxID=2604139 RepID=UPI001D395F77|nr:CYTH domain-containing protein [Pantanalinema sp. GBBB05]
MPTEIERKFLVIGDDWRTLADGVAYSQGYIAKTEGRVVRVRIAGEHGYLTIKGATQGITRSEYEYVIPIEDAREMLHTLCDRPLIEKTRYKIEQSGLVWEVDEFAGDNQGLIMAEVELSDANQAIDLPSWIGEEVSHDPRYYNSNLVKYPYSQWGGQG